MTHTVRIDTIRKRLEDEQGVRFHQQGATIIKTTGDRERHEAPMHYSVESIEQAVAGYAHLVLRGGEGLPVRWRKYGAD